MLDFQRSHKVISNNLDFSNVVSLGLKFCFSGVTFFYAKNNLHFSRFAVSVAKRKIPLSVTRSRVKRLHREVFRSMQLSFSGYDIVVFPKNNCGYREVFCAWSKLCAFLEKS